ncbi:MAG: hypothetical protein GPJ51_11545 [Candidatus Heimdallarchaeota archaeon]|nr:hypothetical protein [Candidatus Heimdallarchaeota archaeon]
MSDYEIKHFQEGFLEDQVKVGTEASKEWQLFGQTNVERLKEVYSQPEFDPETRLYCFKGEELVGFLTSAILPEKVEDKTIGNLSPPLVLEGHENAKELLVTKAIETLKTKGANVIRTFANDTWGGHKETAEKLDFKVIRDTAYVVGLNASSLEITEEPTEVLAYEKERDLDELVQIFMKELGMTEEQAQQNFEVIETSEDILGHYVIRDKDRIVARTYVAKNDLLSEIYVGYIYAVEERYRRQLVAKAAEVCKEKGTDDLRALLFGGMVAKLEDYERLGFAKLSSSSMYEKEI